MSKRIAGICFVKVDGTQLEISGGIECPLAATTKETQMGANGPAGYKETASRPYVKLTAFNRADFPREKLQNGTEMTVTAEFPNGSVYTLAEAYVEGEPVVKSEDGTIELEFSGRKGAWQ